MTECLEQEKARLFIRYLKERGIYMPFFKNYMTFRMGRHPLFNRIAGAFKDLEFNEGIINAGCSFGWSGSNEGSQFWCEEDEVFQCYAGYTNKPLKFIKKRIERIFEDTTLIRKKKF